jgi:hypothetical protein
MTDEVQDEGSIINLYDCITDKVYVMNEKLSIDELRRIHWLTFVGNTDKISPEKWVEVSDACVKFVETGEVSVPKIRVVK